MRVNKRGMILSFNKKEKAHIYQCMLHYIYAFDGPVVSFSGDLYRERIGLCSILYKILRQEFPKQYFHLDRLPRLLPEFGAYKPKVERTYSQMEGYYWPLSPNGEKTRIQVVKKLVELTSK